MNTYILSRKHGHRHGKEYGMTWYVTNSALKMKCLFSRRLAIPPVVQSEEAEAQVFVLVIPEPKIQKYCPFLSFIILNNKKEKKKRKEGI